MAPVSEDELLLQRAVEMKLLTKEQLGRCIAAQKKLLASGKNVSLAAIAKAAKFITPEQLEELKKSLDKEEALPRLGGFEILGRIGKGGMGYVFKARQISMDRLVALKILPPRLAKDKSYVERFHREAKAAARLNHPNIIQSIDVGEQDGHHYFAMEYVEGPTVDEILAKTGRMDENLAIDIVLQVARAIQAAEKLKIVHLDIKPSNIMITSDRVAKLADFGLARRWTEGTPNGRQSIVYGTPEYISPEQALGYTDLDSRSDIYSLGATFYHMLTGEPPFKGATPREIVDKRLTQAPVHPKYLNPSLSDEVCQVLDKMLQRDRNYRYQNASELIADLEFIQRSRSAQAIWPMAFMQQPVQGVQQGDVLYEEVSSIIGPTTLRRAAKPSKAGLVMGLLATAILLGILGAGLYIYLKRPDLWAQVMQILGEETRPQKVTETPRLLGATQTQSVPTPPTPVGQLPPAPPPTTPGLENIKAEADKCIANADQLANEGNYKAALAALNAFPARLLSTIYGQAVEAKRKEIELRAEAKFNRDLETAVQYRRDGKLAESRALLEKMKAYLLPSMEDAYNEAMSKLEAVEKRAQKEITPQDLDKLRAEVREAAKHLLEAGKYDDAVTKLQQMMAEPKYAQIKGTVELELTDVLRVRDFVAALNDGAKSLIGQPISIRGIVGGTLKSFDGNELVVSLNDKDISYKLQELRPRELLKLAQACPSFKAKSEGEQHLMCALYLLARKQIPQASDEFEAAKKMGIDVSRYPEATSKTEAPTTKRPGQKK